MIDAIYSGELSDAPVAKDPTFRFNVVMECPSVPSEILVPRNTWKDMAEYDRTASRLDTLFRENFKAYEDGVSTEVKAAGPVVVAD
jgi:phosphoenolpyruvate carboxykinase (ATP)